MKGKRAKESGAMRGARAVRTAKAAGRGATTGAAGCEAMTQVAGTAGCGKRLRFLQLYPNMMDLYGDSGNLQILRYRAEQRGVKVEVERYVIGEAAPDWRRYDLIFLGGGSDKEQKVVAGDLVRYRGELRKAAGDGAFFLTICGGYQLFGKYYKDAEGNVIEGVRLFDFYTEASADKRQRCIGDIAVEVELGGEKVRLVGFENHGGQTYGVDRPFGRVLAGNGNTFRSTYEGMMTENFIGTYLHGPLLAKNPELADEILRRCLRRATGKEVELAELDDEFEQCAKKEMLERLLG